MNKIIQKLLIFKFSKISWFRHVVFGLQALFVFLLMLLPNVGAGESDGWVVLVWAIFFILREISQFRSLYQAGDFSLSDYFGSFWNWMDLTNIVSQLWYFHYFVWNTESNDYTVKAAEAYSFMVLITWLNTL